MLAVVQTGKVGTSFKIFLIEIRKDSSEDFYYVDEIYVGKDPTNLDEGIMSFSVPRRCRSARMPNLVYSSVI